MTGSRRSFLHTLGLTSLGLTAGCLGQSGSLSGLSSDGECDTPPDTEPIRARGKSTAVTETVTGDNVEYLPETDEVRYVARWRGVGPDEGEAGETPHREAEYETIPFEQWADAESANIAARHARDVVVEMLPTEALSFGVTGENGRLVVLAHLEYLCDRGGTVLSQPPEEVTPDAVADAAPATVDVSFTFEEAEATRSVPVYVRRMTIQQQ
ncbi:hypothetical protein [Halogranum rubrum]|uniref:Lipoprotein n=1 Tax=Halogranum salarium B-1 TaxID=1210908 RepID=J3JF61_9EURY|nr:hypothetical protein [Halogranum salarium]EJN58974.1 hypothetical protein HSB1_23950 [Halogranum salarium B-1]